MKQLLTIIVTILLTAWVLIGGSTLLNGSDSAWISNFFTFGSDSQPISDKEIDDFEKALINADEGKLLDGINTASSDWITEENIVICNQTNQIPKLDPVSGNIICIDADIIDTECVWLDGEAHDLGDVKTQYKPAIKDAENPFPECEEAKFTCVNGLYITTEENASEFNRRECVIIEPEEEDLITCEWNGDIYLPGEAVYRFVAGKVEQTNSCRFVGFYCNGEGNFRSEFDEDIYNVAECTFTKALEDSYMTSYTNELISRWLLKQSTEGELLIVNENFSVENEGESCETPWWETIANGQSVLSFEDETWAWEEECVVRTSQCDDGVFIEREPFDFPSCKIEGPESCNINGYELFHDTNKVFYKYGSYVNGVWECDSQERYCDDGVADGDAAYKYITCTPPAAPARNVAPAPAFNAANAVCPNPYVGGWASWRPDQTGIGYYESSVAFGWECSSVNLVCKFGTIRIWSASSYGGTVGQKFHTSCSAWSPNGCSFNYLDTWSVNVDHGSSVQYYAQASVNFGSTCAPLTASCTNGTMSVSSWYKNCSAGQPAACDSACGSTPHGGTLTTYNFSSLPFGNGVTSCSAVGNAVVTSTCSNGTLSWTPGPHCSCSIAAPVGCSNWMNHGQTITRFNDPGCQADQFGNDLDGGQNSACACKFGSITCNNGSLSKTANYPGDGFPQGSCS